MDENGFYRLETTRIESLEVTQQILSPQLEDDGPKPVVGTCFEIVDPTNSEYERIIVSNDPNEAQLVGEVVISLPSLSEDL